MKIEREENGDFVLDSIEIASRFGLTLERFRKLLQGGQVICTVERGENEDAGSHRVNLRIGNRIWRAVVDEDCRVQSELLSVKGGTRPSAV